MRASTSRAHAERAASGFLRAFRAAVGWLGPLGSPAVAAELDGALVGAVFDGDPASYAAPLVGCVADDLVRAGHVYLPGAGHPGAVGAGR